MTSQFTRRGVLLFCGAGILTAKQPWKGKDSDFWNTKHPSQWSAEEIDRLITKSPWAKPVKVSVPIPAQDAGYNPKIPGVSGRPGSGGGPGSGSSTGGLGIPGISIPGLGGRGGQGRGSGQTQFEVIVRWESAKPVLQALKTELAGVFAKHYVIGINGIPNIHMTPDPQPAAYLEGKGLHPIKAVEIQRAPGTFTQSLLFGFPIESLSLVQDDHEMTFNTRVAKYPISVKFNLKEMIYRDTLAV